MSWPPISMPARSSRSTPSRCATTTRSNRSQNAFTPPSIGCTPRRCGATSAVAIGSKAAGSCSTRRFPMAERPALDAVLFDAGGTLGRLDFEWMAESVRALGIALDAAKLRSAEIEGRRRYDESVGMPHAGTRPDEPSPPLGVVGDTRAYFGGMLVAAGVPETVIPAVLERWRERQAGPGLWSLRMEGAGEALAGVAALALRRAVVSN